jgi:hypothetical protein
VKKKKEKEKKRSLFGSCGAVTYLVVLRRREQIYDDATSIRCSGRMDIVALQQYNLLPHESRTAK